MSYLQIACCLLTYYILSYTEEWILPLFMWILSPVLMLTVSWHLSKYLKENFLHPLMKQVHCSKKVVLITGCDSGFGLATASSLADRGFTVFAACFDEPESLLKKQQHPNIKTIPLDVTSTQSINDAFNIVQEYLQQNPSMSLHALINNAGILTLGLAEWDASDDISYFTKHMEVNCWGHVRMCKKFLPLLRSTGPGCRVINVNSMASRTAAIPVSGYAVSKAAAASFAEALQLELSHFKIHAISIEPWIAETSLSAGDHLISQASKSFERSSTEVQSAYGVVGMNFVRAWVANAKCSPVNITVDLVVERIVDAVTSPDPEPVIRVANPAFSIFFTLANDIVPWRLVILFRHLFHYVMEKAA